MADNEKNTVVLEKERKEKAELVLDWAELIIRQQQYGTLSLLPVQPIQKSVEEIAISDVTCLFKVNELVFKHDEGSVDRFTTVLNSLHTIGATCVMILQCQEGKSELYLGAVNKSRYDNPAYLNAIRDVLRSGLESNLPGTQIEEIVTKREIDKKIAQCLSDDEFDCQCVTAVSCVANESEKKAAGVETLLEAMSDKNFTIMVLADPIDQEQTQKIKRGYEDLSTQLSEMKEYSVSMQSGESYTYSQNYAENVSVSVGKSVSLTQSHTTGSGWSKGTSESQAQNDDKTMLAKIAAIGGGLLAAGSQQSYFAMNAISSLFVNQKTKGENESKNESVSDGTSRTDGTNESESKGTSQGAGTAQTVNKGMSVQTTIQNRRARELSDRLDFYLKWLNRCENYGMFNCCAYILSSTAGTNIAIASQYQALMQGDQELSQPVAINTWTDDNGAREARQALRHMTHPAIRMNDSADLLTPGMLLSSRELSRQMALPQHSVVGVSVTEYASFGREVNRATPVKGGKGFRIGNITHMGKVFENRPVWLDIQSMAAHTFVAGTNGSGKSNTIFKILEEMMAANIPFMVIEPAKGEYKNVFGREKNVKVYGTNFRKTELLRLNPFWFNDDVDVLEHIDKLIDVFNASWPMYAAMPAVLKAAIENAYRSCGWDLKKSVCKACGNAKIFPTVSDVLSEFGKKMDSTAFSDEVRGNYVGALSTRFEQLCNGIYGEIFGGRNLSDEELFDSNVIIDLSRVGSAETKAMIMGMLIIRLQEYRMSTEAMNLPLRHITVLEEAHHLLRQTSSAQSEDGANLTGKSVEMIANAVAEMRSYGEGFVIVDQSPGLLDMSVMRNTNTKIILRLPESGDREIVGRSIGLTTEQIYELSRLKTGVCAIYQKDWREAVLCRVDKASHEEIPYRFDGAADDGELTRRARIVRKLLACFRDAEEADSDVTEDVLQSGMNGEKKRRLLQEFSNPAPDRDERRKLIFELTGDMPADLPRDISERGVAEWLQDLERDETLSETWQGDFKLLVRVRAEYLAKDDAAWDRVYRFLSQDDSIKKSRGRAFSRISPLSGRDTPLTDEEREELEGDYQKLNGATVFDAATAKLLRNYLDGGAIRRKGELQPYTSIVWELLGGVKTWQALFPLLEQGDYEAWDARAREAVRSCLSSDFDTETSVLKLYLQSKGKLSCVKNCFQDWLSFAEEQSEKQKMP